MRTVLKLGALFVMLKAENSAKEKSGRESRFGNVLSLCKPLLKMDHFILFPYCFKIQDLKGVQIYSG